MGVVRVVLKLIGIPVAIIAGYLPRLLNKPIALFSRESATRWDLYWVSTAARNCVRVLGIRIDFNGQPPAGRFFMVSNHVSYLDIIVYLSRVQGVFLAKSEVARWPLLGLAVRLAGTIFVDRGNKADLVRTIDLSRRKLDAGIGLVVFPEGTSSRGAEVLPFKPSIFEVPIRTEVPVSYASIRYDTPTGAAPAQLSICWWGDMPFMSHFLEVLALPRIQATVTFGEDALVERNRKRLAHDAQAAVAKTFVPVEA